MASLKDIRKRISSVKNTQKITRAMKMVAAAKLRRSQQALHAARPYAQQLAKLVAHLAQSEAAQNLTLPLLQVREEVKRVKLIVLTSDRGFCGGFNGNLLRQLWYWLDENEARYEFTELHVIGRKGREFANARKRELQGFETGVYENFNFSEARRRAEQLTAEYTAGKWDECYFVYNRFRSAISQEVSIQKLLPIAALPEQAETTHGTYVPEYIYEPNAAALLAELLPRYLATDIFRIFLESIASEFGARMVAMDAATGNCADMIENLSVLANRLRQAAITNELMDIVNGAESLK